MVVGGFAVVAYNLELFGGRFHTDFWFAAAWGAFPALTGWWSNALAVDGVGGRGGRGRRGARLLRAQRRAAAALDAGARSCAAATASVRGEQRLVDGSVRELSAAALARRSTGRCGHSRSPCRCSPIGLVAVRV